MDITRNNLRKWNKVCTEKAMHTEEKFDLVPKDIPNQASDSFALTLLAGAALHNRDYDSFRQFREKITALKGDNNGWGLFVNGVAAESDLKWVWRLKTIASAMQTMIFSTQYVYSRSRALANNRTNSPKVIHGLK